MGSSPLARKIRTEQDSLPHASRVHIGGELILTTLQTGAVASAVIYRFEDYDEMWQTMSDRLANE
jgi:hypothetical protein